MSARNRLGMLSLLVLAWAAWCSIGCTAEAPPSLDELLKEYRKHELPMPPPEAKLVRYLSFDSGISVTNGKLDPRTRVYSLAFLIKPGTKKEPPRLLDGTRHVWPYGAPHIREVAPEPASANDVSVRREDGLALAIQCHARGWNKLARHLLERSQKNVRTELRKQLLQMAWWYWYDRLTDPHLDRTPVAKHLKELVRQDRGRDTEENQALLRSLDSALAPRKSKPGSIEALIDDLVDYNTNGGTLRHFVSEERYWRIARRGFDAVPALIEHLDDDRLTRAMMQGFNNSPSWHLRVGDVVSDLLEGLAGEDTGRDWLDRQNGHCIGKEKAKKWWEKARKVGEETYVLDHVLVDATERRSAHVSEYLLNVLEVKYPRHIPALYRTVLDKRPELGTGMLADAVRRGSYRPSINWPCSCMPRSTRIIAVA